jgi:hypothetical protein
MEARSWFMGPKRVKLYNQEIWLSIITLVDIYLFTGVVDKPALCPAFYI